MSYCWYRRVFYGEGDGMIAVLSLLVVASLFIGAARVATIALVGTGMATESANFQSRSALMGVGFTTLETEDVINHPVRRKIILWLMTGGNAGIITGITSLLLGFVNAEADQTLQRAAVLLLGLVGLAVLVRLKGLERLLGRFTRWALARWTTLETRDLAHLLRFSHDFGIIELQAQGDDWLVGRPLGRLHLPDEGILILGIDRPGQPFLGAPRGQTIIAAGDTVIAYGRLDHLKALDDRHHGGDGDRAHAEAVEEQLEDIAERVTGYVDPEIDDGPEPRDR